MFAFFVAVMFPFTFATFSNYYLMALLPLFAFLLMMRQNTVLHRWLFGLSLVLLVPWRADLSVAYLVAMLGVIKVVYLTGKFKSYHWIVPNSFGWIGHGDYILGDLLLEQHRLVEEP
jgi:ribose/xylose/arabinose/galactoside ABC-type transport system permease subunit